MYTIDTGGTTPRLTGPGVIDPIYGVVYTDSPGHSVAVFDFDAITIASGETINATGSLPVALLSRGDVTINGTVNVSASLQHQPGFRYRRSRWG